MYLWHKPARTSFWRPHYYSQLCGTIFLAKILFQDVMEYTAVTRESSKLNCAEAYSLRMTQNLQFSVKVVWWQSTWNVSCRMHRCPPIFWEVSCRLQDLNSGIAGYSIRLMLLVSLLVYCCRLKYSGRLQQFQVVVEDGSSRLAV